MKQQAGLSVLFLRFFYSNVLVYWIIYRRDAVELGGETRGNIRRFAIGARVCPLLRVSLFFSLAYPGIAPGISLENERDFGKKAC